MEKNAKDLRNTPGSCPRGRNGDAAHQQEPLAFPAGPLTLQEEALARQEMQKMQRLHHQVTALSWLCQQLQQELAGRTRTGLPFIHQYVIERLAAAIVKRAEQLQQDARRDLERMVSRADNADEV